MVKKIIAEIISNIELTKNIFKLEIDTSLGEYAKPGQFVHVRILEGDYPLLRRPFSINDVYDSKASVLYQVKGVGTELLSQKRRGDRIDILGPLGNGYSLENKPARCLLIGGGMGIAPMPFLARKLKELTSNITIVYGVKNGKDLVEEENIEQLADRLIISSEDGKTGQRGLITDLDIDYAEYDQVYACGPRSLLEIISRKADQAGVSCEISLEEQMACGIGACLGCSTKVIDEQNEEIYQRVCVDGPVFDGRKVVW